MAVSTQESEEMESQAGLNSSLRQVALGVQSTDLAYMGTCQVTARVSGGAGLGSPDRELSCAGHGVDWLRKCGWARRVHRCTI